MICSDYFGHLEFSPIENRSNEGEGTRVPSHQIRIGAMLLKTLKSLPGGRSEDAPVEHYNVLTDAQLQAMIQSTVAQTMRQLSLDNLKADTATSEMETDMAKRLRQRATVGDKSLWITGETQQDLFNAYLQHAIDAGIVVPAGEVQQPAKPQKDVLFEMRAWQWYNDHPWLRGCNYMSADCANRVDQWQALGFEERLETTRRELKLMQDTGFNTIRVILEYVVWRDEHDSFMERFERYLSACGAGKRLHGAQESRLEEAGNRSPTL